ncbi:hypothetical protein BJ912DRAFT_1144513 [Pholiota molesta]|nr:hypothetical protein BJ912DRAFT_1144513 [Pholiota molesta]
MDAIWTPSNDEDGVVMAEFPCAFQASTSRKCYQPAQSALAQLNTTNIGGHGGGGLGGRGSTAEGRETSDCLRVRISAWTIEMRMGSEDNIRACSHAPLLRRISTTMSGQMASGAHLQTSRSPVTPTTLDEGVKNTTTSSNKQHTHRFYSFKQAAPNRYAYNAKHSSHVREPQEKGWNKRKRAGDETQQDLPLRAKPKLLGVHRSRYGATDTVIHFALISLPHLTHYAIQQLSLRDSTRPKNAYSIAFFNLTTKSRPPLERSSLAGLAVTEDVSCSKDPDAGHGCNGFAKATRVQSAMARLLAVQERVRNAVYKQGRAAHVIWGWERETLSSYRGNALKHTRDGAACHLDTTTPRERVALMAEPDIPTQAQGKRSGIEHRAPLSPIEIDYPQAGTPYVNTSITQITPPACASTIATGSRAKEGKCLVPSNIRSPPRKRRRRPPPDTAWSRDSGGAPRARSRRIVAPPTWHTWPHRSGFCVSARAAGSGPYEGCAVARSAVGVIILRLMHRRQPNALHRNHEENHAARDQVPLSLAISRSGARHVVDGERDTVLVRQECAEAQPGQRGLPLRHNNNGRGYRKDHVVLGYTPAVRIIQFIGARVG